MGPLETFVSSTPLTVRSILFQEKHLCAHNVLLSGTIAAGRGIQSEQQLDLDWMRSLKERDLNKDHGAETRSRRGGKQ